MSKKERKETRKGLKVMGIIFGLISLGLILFMSGLSIMERVVTSTFCSMMVYCLWRYE